VNRYLKRWKVPANRFTDQTKVTLRELLSHTAGMTVHGFPGYKVTDRLPMLEQVLNGTPPANTPAIYVNSLPGVQWSYSGGGYVVVQQLIEDVTGQTYSSFLQDVVLGPIGMSHSTYEQPLPRNLRDDAAMPYDSGGQLLEGGPHTYPEEAPAGLWTNPADLARYAIEVQKSLAGKSTRVLSQAMTRRMLGPGLNHWGLGPNVGGGAEHPYFEHGGSNAGYQCELIAYEDGDGVVLMTNSDNGGALIKEVVRTVAYEYQWPDFRPTTHRIARIDPKRFDLLVGSYRLAPTVVLTVTREGDRFFSQATHQGQFEIFPEDEHEYFARDGAASVTFATDREGRGEELTLHQGGKDLPGQRLDEATDKAIVQELATLNKRVRDQVAVPGSELAVRRLMREIAAGKPDYARMSPTLSDVIRQQIEALQKYALQLGSVESVTFEGVRPGGADLYLVTYEHGAVLWGILLSEDGNIDDATFQLKK
jgi:CubicO group peptidase (beta-lactamase class C family)